MSTPSTVRALRLLACLALVAPWCAAADAEAPAAGTSLISEDDKWVFSPPAGRPDVFYDYEQILVIEKTIKSDAAEPEQGRPKGPEGGPTEDPVEFAKQAVQHIEVAMSQRKWDDAIKISDQALKKLAGMPSNAEVAKYIQVIKGYQDQAQDALLRDEAQAAFDALNLKVEGILWSENGPRLVIIGGEPRALGINDRVKDCVIINIDTDRVDFRYHYKRKRFEFPRYVGEDAKK